MNWMKRMWSCLTHDATPVRSCQISPNGVCHEEERKQAEARDREHRQRVRWMRDQAELLEASARRARREQ